MTRTNRLNNAALTLALGTALVLTLTGCISAPITGEPAVDPAAPTESAPAPVESDEPAEPAEPTEQAASCEWDIPAVTADPRPPAGQEGDLPTVLIGSWQHTHFDSGDGWEVLDNDIRYVFPAPGQLIYCQHVPGITDHAENATTHTLEGTLIAPPSHPGWDATAWGADRMVWINNLDGSTYLLVRR
ncbi:MAG TPA: hypothetical protein PK781_03375 [Terrimesophilobacter sp.]|nr:hypothetical protein [Terrimesophilobacter sp.]HRP99483.1 hypothetical protein [Terrimesophilobacter sp.]